jgi:peptidoglycan/xylan/chitin deacetylase (PgdA/CDA1 family)
LTEKEIPTTVYAVGMALERAPDIAQAMKDSNWEVASHGYRWISYQDVPEEVEREHLAKTVKIHQDLLQEKPLGLYQGKPNKNTRKLAVEQGFLYDSDYYGDDLPIWNFEYGRPHLVIPYTLSENDMRFVVPGGFSNGREFGDFLIDSLDYLVSEGRKTGHCSMMSVGLHCRLVGRPGRAKGLEKFLDYAKVYIYMCVFSFRKLCNYILIFVCVSYYFLSFKSLFLWSYYYHYPTHIYIYIFKVPGY